MTSTSSKSNQGFQRLIIPLLGVLALGMGVVAALNPFSDKDGAADSAELTAIQDSLQNSQVLPADFRTVPEFNLVRHTGEAVSASVLDGQWSLLFFGFTQCPDVCPITLSVLDTSIKTLAEDALPKPQVLFVSVDPARDTVEVMETYVSYFNPDFVGITGELNEVHELTRSLGIVASFTANEDNPDQYTVDHTASILLVDPQRRIRAKLNAPHEPDVIAADYKSLVEALDQSASGA